MTFQLDFLTHPQRRVSSEHVKHLRWLTPDKFGPWIQSWLDTKPQERRTQFEEQFRKFYILNKLFDGSYPWVMDEMVATYFNARPLPLEISDFRVTFAQEVIDASLRRRVAEFIQYVEFNEPLDPELAQKIAHLKTLLNHPSPHRFETFKALFDAFWPLVASAESPFLTFQVHWHEPLDHLDARFRDRLQSRVARLQREHPWGMTTLILQRVPGHSTEWDRLIRSQLLQSHVLSYRLHTLGRVVVDPRIEPTYALEIQQSQSVLEMANYYQTHFDDQFRWRRATVQQVHVLPEAFQVSEVMAKEESFKLRRIKTVWVKHLIQTWNHRFQLEWVSMLAQALSRLEAHEKEWTERLQTQWLMLVDSLPQKLTAHVRLLIRQLAEGGVSEEDSLLTDPDFVSDMARLGVTRQEMLKVKWSVWDVHAVQRVTSSVEEDEEGLRTPLHRALRRLAFGFKDPERSSELPVPTHLHWVQTGTQKNPVFLFLTQLTAKPGYRAFSAVETQNWIRQKLAYQRRAQAWVTACRFLVSELSINLSAEFKDHFGVQSLDSGDVLDFFGKRCLGLSSEDGFNILFAALGRTPHLSVLSGTGGPGQEFESDATSAFLDPAVHLAMNQTDLVLSSTSSGSDHPPLPDAVLRALRSPGVLHPFLPAPLPTLGRLDRLKQQLLGILDRYFGKWGRAIGSQISLRGGQEEAAFRVEIHLDLLREGLKLVGEYYQRDPTYTFLGQVRNPERGDLFISTLRLESRMGFFRDEDEQLTGSVKFGFLDRPYQGNRVIELDEDIRLPGWSLGIRYASAEKLKEQFRLFMAQQFRVDLERLDRVDVIDLLKRAQEFGQAPNFIELELSSEIMTLLGSDARTFLRAKLAVQHTELDWSRGGPTFEKLTVGLSVGEFLEWVKLEENPALAEALNWENVRALHYFLGMQHQLVVELLGGQAHGIAVSYFFYLNLLNGLRLQATYAFMEDAFSLPVDQRYRADHQGVLSAAFFLTPSVYLEGWLNLASRPSFDVRLKVDLVEAFRDLE
jgi:hypothetical protein